MANTRETTDIGAKVLRNLLEKKHCGGLHKLEEKKFLVFQKKKWVLRYFFISKGAKLDSIWNLYCFLDQFANKAEWTISMLEMESVRLYDKECDDVSGIRIVFIDPEIPNLILGCDTDENREIWMTKLNEAIKEAHSDSGFASGGSIASLRSSRGSKYSKRESNYSYDTIEEVDVDNTTETKEAQCHAKHKERKRITDVEKEGSVKQSRNKQHKKLYHNYENVTLDNNSKSEDTLVKLPFPVEATEEPQVLLRDHAVKPSLQEAIEKRKGVVVNHQNSLTGQTDAEELSMSASLGRSESFVSVATATERSVSLETMSSLHVTGASSDISSDQSMNADDYQNISILNQRNSNSSSGSDSSYERPVCFTQDLTPGDYFCEAGQDPIGLLDGMPEGTFFIRRNKEKLRLHVMTPVGARCYKLFEQNGKVSLYEDFSKSPDSVFTSLDNFLKHYSVHCLPKDEYKVRLERGFKNNV